MTNSNPAGSEAAGGSLRAAVTIVNKRGLHARASAKFVKRAGEFDAVIQVTRDGTTVLGTSIMGLMMLAASPGSEIIIEANGKDAQEALAAMVALVESKFDED